MVHGKFRLTINVSGSSGSCTGNAATATTANTALRFNSGICTVAAGTAAKTVSIPALDLTDLLRITVRFPNGNTAANATLNFNNTEDYPIYYRWAPLTSANASLIAANGFYDLMYWNKIWFLIGNL